MRTLVTLALFLVIGFAGSRGFVARVTHRLPLAGLLATGMEFFVLGVLIGPRAFNLITAEVLADLEPIVYLALGWVGFLFGIEMSWSHVRKISRGVFRFLLVDTIVSLILFGGIIFFVLKWLLPGFSVQSRLVTAVVFGITATVTSPTTIAVVSQRLRARGPLTATLKAASALSALFPLIAFGFLFMVIHPRFFGMSGIGHGLFWWLIVNVVGALLGFFVVLFTQERSSNDEMRLLVVGAVLLIGGVCYFLHFSSLYTAMIVGVVVGNFSRRRDQIFRELHVVEQTLFVGLFILVGAMVALPNLPTIGVVAGYAVLRIIMRYAVTGSVLIRSMPELASFGRGVGLALTGQGVMAVAIALDCAVVADAAVTTLALTVVTFAVLIADGLAYGFAGRTLRASGEVPAPRGKRRKV